MNRTIQRMVENNNRRACDVRVVLFDFGGVLAEEGFRNGLMTIAGNNGLEPRHFTQTAFELIFATGYVTGRATEAAYWDALREKTGIAGDDAVLRSIILEQFTMRRGMIGLVENLRRNGVRTAILSDQTDWLDELDRRYGFFGHFERVFNSFYLNKSKREPGLFDDVAGWLGVKPEEILFVDDSPGNVERAGGRGLHAVLFKDEARFRKDLRVYCQGISIS